MVRDLDAKLVAGHAYATTEKDSDLATAILTHGNVSTGFAKLADT
ncbi:MAG TPA: hypothetical protein VMI06_16365 [Terriglobia bacterium]|nr:hypothetical protein [Terriglobia bacterium]